MNEERSQRRFEMFMHLALGAWLVIVVLFAAVLVRGA